MQTGKARPPVWLIVAYGLSLLTIAAWPFIAGISFMAFDAPGSAHDPAIWGMVIAIWSYPLLPVVGVTASFLLYRSNRKVLAYVLAALGAIPLAIFVAFAIIILLTMLGIGV